MKESFAQQVAANESLIHKICRFYGKTEQDRQDLFQEILVQAWQAYGKFRGEAKFSTWLYRVAINTAISGIRKKKRTVPVIEFERMPDIADPADTSKEEHLRELYTAISRLNQIEKALIFLYLEERSYKEMESILGISEGALRVKMNRVKEKLRQTLKK